MNMGNYKVVHGKGGRFMSLKRYLFRLAFIWLAIIGLFFFFVYGHPMVLSKLDSMMSNTMVAKAEAQTTEIEKLRALPIEVLEERLDNIVWGGESQKKVMKDGEILQTFDPADAEEVACMKQGGKQPKYCISWGPRQIKMSMIEFYWPKIHDGKTITDMEAIQIANDNEQSKRFFLDCAVKVTGCAAEWSTFKKHAVEGQVYIELIREVK